MKVILAIIIFAGIAVTGHTQVNQDELRQDLPQVIFINYEGPHARIDTREQIRQIGVVLGRQIAVGEENMAATIARMSLETRRTHSYSLQAGAVSRYYVIHSISGPEDGKIDADIFSLGVDTGVDHVRNLRTIIQGYLQDAYEYSERDAALLAEYITIYNAVYRGNWDYFTERFKTQVINNLVRERTGLSIRYDEWPGRTMILIPLGHGGLSAIDTSTIADSRVIEELRREDDMGIQQRQDMVDLREREAEQAEQLAQTERQIIRQEERAIAEERQDIEQERQTAQEDQQAGRISQEEEHERQEELDRREQALEERNREIDHRREEAQRLEDFAERQIDETQQERQRIAEDQQTIIVTETTDGVFGLIIERENPTIMGRIVRVSTEGMEIRRSPLNTVHVRTVNLIGGRIIAIAGENRGNGAVRLVEVNQSNLEMARQGDDDIMTGSLLWVNGNDLYAITVDLRNNNCYLGRFDTNLALQSKTSVRVHPNASITIQQGRLLTQSEDGSSLMLDPVNLTEVQQ